MARQVVRKGAAYNYELMVVPPWAHEMVERLPGVV